MVRRLKLQDYARNGTFWPGPSSTDL